jgi:hypothetical protein
MAARLWCAAARCRSARVKAGPAKAYLFSVEYGEARKLREGAGEIDLIAVEGA